MDITFTDPNEVPLPPDEVRIRALRAEPWPDGLRVKIYLEVDPFQKRPNAELVIHDNLGHEIASTSIIESIERKMEVTMHLRGAGSPGPFRLHATLFYADIEDQLDPQTTPRPIERMVVDQAQAFFEVGGEG